MSQPVSIYADKHQCRSIGERLGLRSANRKREHRKRLPLSSLARCVVLPLAVQIFSGGCTHWVTIEPDFAAGRSRTLDKVRIDYDTVLRNAKIDGPIVTADELKRITVDLRETSPVGLALTQEDADAIAKGLPRQLDRVQLGNDVLSKATLTWPHLTGYKKTPLTLDLRIRVVEREAVDPGPTATIVTLSILGGIGLVSLGVYGLTQLFSKSNFYFGCAC